MSTVEGKDVVARYRFLVGEGMQNVARMTEAVTSGAKRQATAMNNVQEAVHGVSAAITRAAEIANNASTRIHEGLNRINNRMMVTGAAGLVASGGMIKLAMNMEQTSIAFTTLLGSGQAARAMLADLQQFAATTPFEFVQLTDASRRLMAFGFQAQDIIPMLTDIGDAVAAMGGNADMVNRVILALGQMQAKSKVSAQEMMQLTEAGIPAWRYLAESLGKSTAEVMKLSEQGLVPADMAIEALRKGMRQDFGGMMAQQAKTAAGAVSNLKDQLGLLGNALGQGMLPMFKPAIQLVSELTAKFNALSEGQKAAIGQTILWGSLTLLVGGAIGKVLLVITPFIVAWKVINILQKIYRQLAAESAAATGTQTGMLTAQNGALTTNTVGWQSNTTAMLQNLGARAKQMGGTAGSAIAGLPILVPGGGGGAAAQTTMTVWGRVGAFFTGLWARIQGAATGAFGRIAAAGARVLPALLGAVTNPVGLIIAAVAAAVAGVVWMAAKFESVRDLLAGMWTQVSTAFSDVFSSLGQAFGGLWAAISPLAQLIGGALGGALLVVLKYMTWIVSMAANTLAPALRLIGNLGRWVGHGFKMFGAILQGIFTGNWKPALAEMGGAFNSIRLVVINLGQTVTNFLNSFLAWIPAIRDAKQYLDMLEGRSTTGDTSKPLPGFTDRWQKAREAYLKEHPEKTPPGADEEDGKLAAATAAARLDATIAAEEAGQNKIRRAIDLRFAREWGQRNLLAAVIGGHYAEQIRQQEELARAEQEAARARNDATAKYHQELRKLGLADDNGETLAQKNPEEYAARTELLKTQMTDALDAAAAALEQKKLSVELEIKKSSFEQFKDRIQNAFELTILGPRFKEMYKASFQGLQGQMAGLAAMAAPGPLASLSPAPLRALAPAGGPGGLGLPLPMLPAPGGQAVGNNEVAVRIIVENNPKALGIIKALAKEGAVEIVGDALGAVTR